MSDVIDALDSLRIDVQALRKKKGLIWQTLPDWMSVASPGAPSGCIDVFTGTLACPESEKIELVGHYLDEKEFWIAARSIILDWGTASLVPE